MNLRRLVAALTLALCLSASSLKLGELAFQTLAAPSHPPGGVLKTDKADLATRTSATNQYPRIEARRTADRHTHARDYLRDVDGEYVRRLDIALNNGYEDEAADAIVAALQSRQLTLEQATQSVERLTNLRPQNAGLLQWAASILAESIAQEESQDRADALEIATVHIIYRLQDIGDFEAAVRMASSFSLTHPDAPIIREAKVMSLAMLGRVSEALELLNSLSHLPEESHRRLQDAVAEQIRPKAEPINE